jgi:hypothetical protein
MTWHQSSCALQYSVTFSAAKDIEAEAARAVSAPVSVIEIRFMWFPPRN